MLWEGVLVAFWGQYLVGDSLQMEAETLQVPQQSTAQPCSPHTQCLQQLFNHTSDNKEPFSLSSPPFSYIIFTNYCKL